MDLAARLTEHLNHLSGQTDADVAHHMREVAAALAHLVRDLLAEVPSCLTVSILLNRPAGIVTVSLPVAAHVAREPAVVRASLAIPLAVSEGETVLLLQAAHAGAFVLFADDVAGQRDPADPPLLVDRHLVLLTDPDGGRLSDDLAGLKVVEQAIGALIEQGWPPAEARRELTDRALAAELPAPALARRLLAALPRPTAVGDPRAACS